LPLLHHLWKNLDERIVLEDQVMGLLHVKDYSGLLLSSFFVPEKKHRI